MAQQTAIFKDPLFLEHMAGFNHIESSLRLQAIYDALAAGNLSDNIIFPEFEAASPEILALNHSPAYIKKIAATSGKQFCSLDPDTQTSPLSYDAACLAAGAAVTATKMIVEGSIKNAFCLVRPPGHHAETNQAMGFCLFNNVAIAAQYAIRQLKLERVLLVDWDLHHGNGTQNSFYNSSNVLYFSAHQYHCFPGSGAAHETGKGKGEGFTINVPLPTGLGDTSYAAIFNDLLSPVARHYKPQLVIVSAGFDTHRFDPLGSMKVRGRGFAYMTKVLMDIAAEFSDHRLLACLEGGYDLIGLREGTMATINEMSHQSILSVKDLMELTSAAEPGLFFEESKNIIHHYWKI